MHRRNPDKRGSRRTKGAVTTCLLCNRDFCETHKGGEDGICEINHGTYCRGHPNLNNIYPTLAVRERMVCLVLNIEDALVVLSIV
jgi:hypothetical protein